VFTLFSFLSTCRNNDSSFYDEYDDSTAKITASITIWRSLLESGIPIIFALFLGPWTDLHGRKGPMLFSMFGYSVQLLGLILISSQFPTWNAQLVAIFAALPVALTGSQTAFNMCLYSYIADTTSIGMRTLRIGIANACWFLGISLGLGLGGALAKPLGYTGIFGTALGLEVACMIAVFWGIKNTRKIQIGSGTLGPHGEIRESSRRGKLREIFNCQNLTEGFKAVFKKREDNGRLKMILMLVALVCTMGPILGN
jgi:MFS family permease